MASGGNLEGQFSGTGSSSAVFVSKAYFNVSLWDGDGTVLVERSFDEGVTWVVVKTLESRDFEGVGYESESRVQYRFRCTVYGSGPISYRLGIRRN